ncbi:hypothetical protein SELMODRAFT_443141 [Selaginella moellendorffii]|uniref:Uncharacterized protein n=2 Tax=Selaginella moellendorffii TaxID=88036 RepID=D8RYZ2_SELML|nr:hypothetical protein SELMODRAFT_443141 [Selaginella moellendorffii]
MASEKAQELKDTAGQKWNEATGAGQQKTGEAQKHSQEAAGATKEKTHEAGQATQDKWGQTKQGTGDATHGAQAKAAEAKDHTGNVLQQVGDQVKGTVEKAKETLSGGGNNNPTKTSASSWRAPRRRGGSPSGVPSWASGRRSPTCDSGTRPNSSPGDYKVVVWFSDGTLYTFARGQAAWIPAKGGGGPGSIPALLDGVVYCTASHDRKWLLQYDLTRNKFLFSHLYDKVGDGVCVAAWGDKLYVLVLNVVEKGRVEIWEVRFEVKEIWTEFVSKKGKVCFSYDLNSRTWARQGFACSIAVPVQLAY